VEVTAERRGKSLHPFLHDTGKIKSEENFEERLHHYSLASFLHYLYFFLEK
jgi:hypothetical protein